MILKGEGDHKSGKEEGATLVEYMLLALLIALVCVVGLSYLGEQTSQSFSRVGSFIGSTSN